MKAEAINLDGKAAGSVDLNDDIFGLEPRVDILHRVVRWQRNNAQAGTHKVKTRSEVKYSTKKIYRQKGTGGARRHELTKKFRKLGLRHALSAKAAAGELVIVDSVEMKDAKTSALAKQVNAHGWKRTLVIDATVNENFAVAARNITSIDVLPSMGANVYDILKSDTLVLTKAGVEALEARLS